MNQTTRRSLDRLGVIARYAGVIVLVLISLFPFAWMLVTALKPESEVRSTSWIPEHPTLENFFDVFQQLDLGRMIANSFIVAIAAAVLSTAIGLLGAYGLSRLFGRGANWITLSILAAQMLPAVLLVVPYFIMFRQAGILDSLVVLIVADVSFSLPICTWLLRRFIQKVPQELDEAAMVDGCSRFGALIRVVMPASRAGIAAAFFYAFLVSWQEYLFALSLTSSPEQRVITLGIGSLIGEFGVSWGQLMAIGLVSVLPLLVVFLLVERNLVEGLAGGIKG